MNFKSVKVSHLSEIYNYVAQSMSALRVIVIIRIMRRERRYNVEERERRERRAGRYNLIKLDTYQGLLIPGNEKREET